MVKVLWVPQLSFVDKVNYNFLLNSDSNIHFARRIFPLIHETFPEWQINLITPDFLDQPDFNQPYLYKIKYEKLFIPDAFLSRVYFSLNEWKKILKLTEPDILWLNTPELVQNFTTLREKMNLNFKIITYHHWVDLNDVQRVPRSMSYIWRETEGAYKSDVTLFNSKFIIEKFLNSTIDFFGPNILKTLKEKTLPLYIPWQKKIVNKQQKISNKVSILWEQRLSQNSFYAKDREYWWNLFDKYADNIDLTISNPSGFVQSKNRSYIKEVGPFNYDEFLTKLCNADLTFGPTQSPIQWSLNVTDALEVDTPALLIYKDAFMEMISEHYPFMSLTREELTRMFIDLITQDKIWELRKKSQNLTQYFKFNDNIIKEQLLQINELIH